MSEACEGIRYLSYDDLVTINRRLIEAQTPLEPIGVLKEGELRSAQQRPSNYRFYQQTEDIITLAAVLAESIAKNHGFLNANKRTAAAAATVFLLLNGIELTAPDHELVEVIVDLVTGEVDASYLEDWLHYWHRPFDAYLLSDSDAFERMQLRWGTT